MECPPVRWRQTRSRAVGQRFLDRGMVTNRRRRPYGPRMSPTPAKRVGSTSLIEAHQPGQKVPNQDSGHNPGKKEAIPDVPRKPAEVINVNEVRSIHCPPPPRILPGPFTYTHMPLPIQVLGSDDSRLPVGMGCPVQTAQIGDNRNTDTHKGNEEGECELVHSATSQRPGRRCRTLFLPTSPVKRISPAVRPSPVGRWSCTLV